MVLSASFFDRDAQVVAIDLLGKVIRAKYQDLWLSARIIETEAYYLHDKASHASLGYTLKRKALFMPPGTIYMYHARGKASMNVSCQGPGNAVLLKAGFPYLDERCNAKHMIAQMQDLNPYAKGGTRPVEKLCAGQTLLCQALCLTVGTWDQQAFDTDRLFIEDVGYRPVQVVQTTRMGIASNRDAHLPYRFIDCAYAPFCTQNPIRKRGWKQDVHYRISQLQK